MRGYVGPKFAKKATDEELLLMADLADERSDLHNKYVNPIEYKMAELRKKYKIQSKNGIEV